MVYKIIREIESSLKTENFLAALALALMLPDICGKAEYPNEKKNNRRYKNWYDEYVGKFEKSPEDNSNKGSASMAVAEMPYMSSEIVYSLRNSFLHQGTPGINEDDIHEPACQVNHFTLTIENAISGGSASVWQDCFTNSESRTLEINIVNLCWKLSLAAKKYYENNKEKFNFFLYDLKDKRNGESDLLCGIDISE